MSALFLKKNYLPREILQLIVPLLVSEYPTETEQTQVALWLIEQVTSLSPERFFIQTTICGTQVQQIYHAVVEHIHHHKPLAYILGTIPFGPLTLRMQSPILIPRPETEYWVMQLIADLTQSDVKPKKILDIGTGSGAIALAMAHAFPDCMVYGVDINPTAIALAQENARFNTITNATFVYSDLFDAVTSLAPFDLIISNPPYIAPQEKQHLDKSVVLWEDPQALYAADDGLHIIKKIIEQAPKYLTATHIPNLVLEIGYQQGMEVTKLLHAAGYSQICVYQDMCGKDRYVYAQFR